MISNRILMEIHLENGCKTSNSFTVRVAYPYLTTWDAVYWRCNERQVSRNNVAEQKGGQRNDGHSLLFICNANEC